ncbi:ABC transporter ATP-binding protein [Candidatus Parcubacteria bacterium]|jgi:putative ABC transport system ATP-binding protein|nr:MAG: ABC transporter ATP-binding protein [Candidatus Parcubacteria bacterium]GIW69178.1 MAG: ABC transporter ATP-binding protein [Candidatus Parcubacteria bacterium]
MPRTIISTHNVRKVYQKGAAATVALDGVSVEIQEGEYVAIIGKSGAGKSTLLYQLSLLDEPTEGEVIFLGKPTASLTDTQRTLLRLEHLGYIFQDYALLPELTATENVMVPMLMRGVEEEDARARAQEALRRVEMGHRLNNRPNELSGGEQQRVSIARAIADAPDILFADEPTANLDTVMSFEVLEQFDRLHREGLTIVTVTHELEYARRANRVIELRDGKILRDGPAEEVIREREAEIAEMTKELSQ